LLVAHVEQVGEIDATERELLERSSFRGRRDQLHAYIRFRSKSNDTHRFLALFNDHFFDLHEREKALVMHDSQIHNVGVHVIKHFQCIQSTRSKQVIAYAKVCRALSLSLSLSLKQITTEWGFYSHHYAPAKSL
jgi:hypothetical protein